MGWARPRPVFPFQAFPSGIRHRSFPPSCVLTSFSRITCAAKMMLLLSQGAAPTRTQKRHGHAGPIGFVVLQGIICEGRHFFGVILRLDGAQPAKSYKGSLCLTKRLTKAVGCAWGKHRTGREPFRCRDQGLQLKRFAGFSLII